MNKYDYIFVSSHKEVRDVLINNNLLDLLIYTSLNREKTIDSLTAHLIVLL